jgi:hypothetical protein
VADRRLHSRFIRNCIFADLSFPIGGEALNIPLGFRERVIVSVILAILGLGYLRGAVKRGIAHNVCSAERDREIGASMKSLARSTTGYKASEVENARKQYEICTQIWVEAAGWREVFERWKAVNP